MELFNYFNFGIILNYFLGIILILGFWDFGIIWDFGNSEILRF